MATKIRLQRHGKKGKPFFHLVAADSRSPRDGRFIEKLGTYNPTSNPATIDLNFDRCVYWVKSGAEATDTARAILSYKGVLFKSHLEKGVAKGAISADQANAKFEKWAKEKESKIQGKKEGLAKVQEEKVRNAKKHETSVNEAKAAKIASKASETPVAESAETPETPAE